MSFSTLNSVIIVNPISGHTSIVTAAGTTILDATSTRVQEFTGVTTQTVEFPKLTTLINGFEFELNNQSTGVLTVNTAPDETLVSGTQPLSVAPFTLTVDSTNGFPTSGSFSVVTTVSSPQTVTYTGTTATTFTGCVAGGAFTTNNNSVLTSLDPQIFTTVSGSERKIIRCIDTTAIAEADGWFITPSGIASIDTVMDSAATPTYPQDLTKGVWYGLNTKANAFNSNCVTLGSNANTNGNSGVAVGTNTVAVANSVAISTNAGATGLSSISIGSNSDALGSECISIGLGAQSNSVGGIAIGSNSVGTNLGVVSMGLFAVASQPFATAIGGGSTGANSAHATATRALAIGLSAYATSDDTTAVGSNTSATSTGTSAFGGYAKAVTVNTTAIGYNTCDVNNTGTNHTALGKDALSAGTTFTGQAVPTFTGQGDTGGVPSTVLTITAVTTNAIVVGMQVTGTGISAGTYIDSFGTGTGGLGTYNLNQNATVVALAAITGVSTLTIIAGSPNALLVIGSTISGTGVVGTPTITALMRGTIGVNNSTYTLSTSQTVASTIITTYSIATGMIAIGYQAGLANVTGTTGILIGNQSNVIGTNSIAIGTSSSVTTGGACISIGENALTKNIFDEHSVAIGKNSIGGRLAVSIGENANSYGGNGEFAQDSFYVGGVAIGYNTDAAGCRQGVAIGMNAVTVGGITVRRAVAIGSGASASFECVSVGGLSFSNLRGVAVGDSSSATGNGAIAIGEAALVTQSSSIAIGRDASCTITDAVALGFLASPIDSSHAFALRISGNSVVPGRFGLTLNGAASQIAKYGSLYATTATAAGTTTLDVASAQTQVFTGVATQTIELPQVRTLSNGFWFKIVNNSTGLLTIVNSPNDISINGTQNLTVAPFSLVVDQAGGTASYPTSGSLSIITTVSSPQTITYTGKGATTPFTGCVAGGSFTTNNNTTVSFVGTGDTVATISAGAHAEFICTDINGSLDSFGWLIKQIGAVASIDTVMDSAATPTYPQDLTKGVWYGLNTKANAFDSTCITIGNNADTGDNDTIAIGGSATVTQDNSIAIGSSASATSRNSISIGTGALATGIGTGNGIAIGISSRCYTNGVCIGNDATAISNEEGMIVIGANSSCASRSGTVVGTSAIGSLNSYATGFGAGTVTRAKSVAVGGLATITASESAIAIGYDALTSGIQGTCLGLEAIASGHSSVCVGTRSVANVIAGIAIGREASTGGINNAIVLNASQAVRVPINTAHAFTIATNSASVTPATFGITLNNAVKQIETYSSLYATTATAAGTTNLTGTSAHIQKFTGVTTQTIELAKVLTFVNGFEFEIINQSTGSLTINTAPADTLVNGTQPLTVAPFTLTVDSTAGFPTSGSYSVVTTVSSPQTVTYTGTTATTFTGCVAGGAFTTNNNSTLTSLNPQLLTTVASGNKLDLKCVDTAALIESDGWYIAPSGITSIDTVMDSAATPTYPQDLTKGVWYGLNTKANAFNSTCVTLGQNATTGAPNQIAIGNSADASTFNDSIAIGTSAVVSGFGAIAIGNLTSGLSSSVALGNGASATALGGAFTSVAIGTNATATSNTSVAIGASTVSNNNGISIGYAATSNSSGGNAVCIGVSASALGLSGSITIGQNATSTGTYAISIGRDTSANSIANAISLGYQASPLDTAHAFAMTTNAASVFPGTLGITLNSAARQIETYTSLFNTTVTSTNVISLTQLSAQRQYLTGTVAQDIVLHPVNKDMINNGFRTIISNLSTQPTTVYAPSAVNTEINGAQVASAGTITVDNVAGFTITGNITVVSDTGIQIIAYTGLGGGTTFTGCTGGTGNLADNAIVAQSFTIITTIASLAEEQITCIDEISATLGVNGWYVTPGISTIDVVMDSAATPTYPQDLSKGVWMGLNTKANAANSTCVTLGQNANTNGTNSIAVGVNAVASTTAVAIGGAANAPVNGIAIGNTVNISGDSSVGIGTLSTASGTAATAVGRGARANAQASVSIGWSSLATGIGSVAIAGGTGGSTAAVAIATSAIAIGGGSRAETASSIAFGNNARATGTQSIAIGRSATSGNTQTLAIGVSANASAASANAIGHLSVTSAANATTIGDNFTNSVANTMSLAPNATEAFRVLDPAIGNFTHRTGAAAVIAGATPTPTDAQLVGGYIQCSDAAGVTLTIGTGGITGTTLSAYAQIAGNAYVGLTFKCLIVGTGAATNITVSGTANTASNGITPRGLLTSSALQSRELTFINTGTNTWDMIVV